jgi:hypothetical protein
VVLPFFLGAVQVLLIAFVVVAPRPASIDRNPKPMPTVATAMKCHALKQNLNHLLLQTFDLRRIQPGNNIPNRVTRRHRKPKQAFVVQYISCTSLFFFCCWLVTFSFLTAASRCLTFLAWRRQ